MAPTALAWAVLPDCGVPDGVAGVLGNPHHQIHLIWAEILWFCLRQPVIHMWMVFAQAGVPFLLCYFQGCVYVHVDSYLTHLCDTS